MASLKSLDEMYRHEAYVINTVEGPRQQRWSFASLPAWWNRAVLRSARVLNWPQVIANRLGFWLCKVRLSASPRNFGLAVTSHSFSSFWLPCRVYLDVRKLEHKVLTLISCVICVTSVTSTCCYFRQLPYVFYRIFSSCHLKWKINKRA